MDNKQLLFDIHETEQNRVSTNDEPAKKSSGSTSELNDKLSHLEVLEMLVWCFKSFEPPYEIV